MFTKGFSLPSVLIIGLALMIITTALSVGTTSIADSLNDRYFNRLAQTAAEAGAAYAAHCLSKSDYQQTWGSSEGNPNLGPGTDCSGNPISGASQYVLNSDLYKTQFSVGNLELQADGMLVVEASGSVSQTLSGTTTTVRTFNASRKKIVQWEDLQPTVSTSGSFKTCAILSGKAWCWGWNGNASEPSTAGNLGDGTTTDSLVPVKVAREEGVLKGKVVSDIVAAQYHVCALAEAEVYCWGNNGAGQLGDGTTTRRLTPIRVGGLLSGKTVTAIGASGDTTCAVADRKIYCWGSNLAGTVGDNSTSNRTLPVAVTATNLPADYTATKLSTGSRSRNMCAVVNAWAYCWGNNDSGQIGNGAANSTFVRIPTRVNDGAMAGKSVTNISHDGYYRWSGNPDTHVCAVASSELYCWGDNDRGQLGRGGSNQTTSSSVPVRVNTGALGNQSVTDVISGLGHTCALAQGKVYCWGLRNAGQVGNNTNHNTVHIYTPVSVFEEAGALQGKTVIGIGGGSNRGCALTNPIVYCWGSNGQGQIGDGTTATRLKPTESVFLRPQLPSFLF